MTGAAARARDGWIAVAIVAAAVMFALALGGCPAATHPRGAAFAKGAEDCAVQLAASSANDLVGEAIASASSSPGAPTWATFSMGELVSRGPAFAICIVEKAIAAVDMKLPPAAADAAGDVAPTKLQIPQASTEARGFFSGAAGQVVSVQVAASLTAHARMVDFLNTHGVTHSHATVSK